MGDAHEFEIAIIGSGSGGGVAAHMLANQGKRVALIDKGAFGGECPRYGCMPTKALLESAKVFEIAKQAPQYGIRIGSLGASFAAMQVWAKKVVRESGLDDNVQTFVHEGITTLKGRAFFIDPHTVSIGDRRVSAKHFIVATGSTPRIPDIEGLTSVGFITHRDILELPRLPKSLFIIGAGTIGCEYAEFFSTFGTRVHIAETATRLLSGEDPEASKLVEQLFEAKGVHIHTSTTIEKIEGAHGRKTVTYRHGGESHTVTVEEIMVAVGRKPNVDLGLDNAGIRYSPRGITTNSLMRTSSKHIYAIGDATGGAMYTHTANYQARIAVYNLTHSKPLKATYHAIPHCTYVGYEVATVGYSEAALQTENIAYQVGHVPLSVVARSITSGHPHGFVKIFASHTGVILGGTIVAYRAGEMIHELTLAVQRSMKARDIADTVHAFPTWSEAIRVACAKISSL